MSETLTESALAAGEEAPTVVVDAPLAPGSEVEAGSGSEGPGDWVEKARFNGLMSSFNRAQTELQQAQTQIAALTDRLDSQHTPQEGNNLTEVSTLEAQIQALTAMVAQEQLKNTRAEVFKEFPEAEAFADLISASSPDEFREMAKAVAERVRSAVPGAGTQEPVTSPVVPAVEGAQAPEAPAAPEAPVVGGGVPFNGEVATDERVADAIKNRNFSAYLSAKWQSQVERNPDLALEDG